MVKHRDRVLCPCGNKQVLSASSVTSFYGSSTGKVSAESFCAATPHSSSANTFDGQVLASLSGTSIEGYPYLIETDDGQISSGRFDGNQRLPRVQTEGPDNYTVYWGDDALDRQEKIR